MCVTPGSIGEEPALLLRLGAGERESAHRSAMKRSEEGNYVMPFGVIPRKLQGTLDRLRAGVAVIQPVRSRHGSDRRQPLGKGHQALVVEVCPRHVDQLRSLLLDRCNYLGVAVPRRGDRYAGGEIEKLVAVYVLDATSTAPLGDHGIRAGVAG